MNYKDMKIEDIIDWCVSHKETEWLKDTAAKTFQTKVTTGSVSVPQTVGGKCDITTTEIIPIVDHDYGNWTVIVAATGGASGSKKRVCKSCGDEQYKTIPPYGDSLIVVLQRHTGYLHVFGRNLNVYQSHAAVNDFRMVVSREIYNHTRDPVWVCWCRSHDLFSGEFVGTTQEGV